VLIPLVYKQQIFHFKKTRCMHKGQLWALAWFTKIVFGKVCVYVCLYVCIYVCLSFRTHVSKPIEAKSSLYTRNEGYIEPVLNLQVEGKIKNFKLD